MPSYIWSSLENSVHLSMIYWNAANYNLLHNISAFQQNLSIHGAYIGSLAILVFSLMAETSWEYSYIYLPLRALGVVRRVRPGLLLMFWDGQDLPDCWWHNSCLSVHYWQLSAWKLQPSMYLPKFPQFPANKKLGNYSLMILWVPHFWAFIYTTKMILIYPDANQLNIRNLLFHMQLCWGII